MVRNDGGFMISTVIAFCLAHAHWLGVLGSITSGAGVFFQSAQKYLLIGAAVVIGLLALANFAQHERHLVDVADFKAAAATVHELQVAADRATVDLEACHKVNVDNLTQIKSIKADADAAIASAYADANRIKKEAASIAVARSVTHEKAVECPAGNPATYRSIYDWLRANPDPSTATAGSHAHP